MPTRPHFATVLDGKGRGLVSTLGKTSGSIAQKAIPLGNMAV